MSIIEETVTKITRELEYTFFDINGEQEPNILGKDQYRIETNTKGLSFDTAEEAALKTDKKISKQYSNRTM